MAAAKKTFHGDDLLYRFFVTIFEDESQPSHDLLIQLFSYCAIWIPTETYQVSPVLLPHVIRDAKCRGNKAKGIPDQWGAPNDQGFFRDDNSMIKNLTRSLRIRSKRIPNLNGSLMGREFVAAHIWRMIDHEELASRVPEFNSFVPNLVWLPSQVAKLSDREGSVMQRVLQAMAWSIYRSVKVNQNFEEVIEKAWLQIPAPDFEINLDLTELNWFEIPETFVEKRRNSIEMVIRATHQILDGEHLSSKVISSRYTDGLPLIGHDSLEKLGVFLRQYVTEN